MENWKRLFKPTDRCPARLVLPGKRIVDFRSNKNNIEWLLEIWESGLPYLEITEAGKKELYKIETQKVTDLKPETEKVKPPAELNDVKKRNKHK
jgi:hypothetical protein